MEWICAPFELKFADAAPGTFEGYASVFGVLDSHRDVVEPGAFKGTIAAMKARGFNVPLYLNHGARGGTDHLPAGVWNSIEEDSTGLAVKGTLLGLNTDSGKYKYELVKGGALRGMSIGYSVPAGGAAYGKTPNEPRRRLKTVNLGEISLVDNPSNHMSAVMGIKSLEGGDLTAEEIREIEAAFRTKGLSRADAAKAISGLKDYLRRDAEDPATDLRDEGTAELAALLRRNIATLSGV